MQSKIKVQLFPPEKPKNRLLTPWELQEEKIVANVFKRPMRYYTQDPPFYPYVVPEPKVNFQLNYKDK